MFYFFFLPIVAVFVLSYLTKNVLLSLNVANGIGILLLIYKKNIFSFSSFFQEYLSVYKKVLNQDTIMIVLFIFFLSSIIELLISLNVTTAYASLIKSKIKSKRSLEITTLALNYLFFIDDFLGAFSLKAFIYPLIRVYKMASVKLAYLINAQFTSLCLLIPLSSWGLMLLGQYTSMQSVYPENMLYNPVSLLFRVIPFLLYPINSIINAWFIVIKNISYGSMRMIEEQEHQDHNLATQEIENRQEETYTGRWYDFFGPFIFFFIDLSLNLISFVIKYRGNLIESLLEFNLIKYVFLAALRAYLFSFIYFGRKLSLGQGLKIHTETISSIKKPVLLIVSAWAFSYIISSLDIFSHLFACCSAFNITIFYPIIFFILSFFASMSIGSEWGVIALIVPIVGSLNILNPIILYILLGATLSATIAGCHFTPISNDIVIVSTNVKCSILDHFKTHSEYSFSPLIGSFIGFLIMTLLAVYEIQILSLISFIGISVSSIITILITYFKNKRQIY